MALAPHDDFISEHEACLIQKQAVHLYAYRNGVLKRAPKTEFYRSAPLRYSWGQHLSNDRYARKFLAWMEAIARRLHEPVNHAIIIRYHHGTQTHAPWHHDKCEEHGRKAGCMRADTGFHVVSVGVPRVFQLGNEAEVVWECPLPHRSLLSISSAANRKWKHCVPPDSTHEGIRWSLIFRTIASPATPRRLRLG